MDVRISVLEEGEGVEVMILSEILLDDVERRGSPEGVGDEPGRVGDWVGFEKTVVVIVIVTGSAPTGVEDEGSGARVDPVKGLTEDMLIESREEERVEGVEDGGSENVVEDGSAGVEDEGSGNVVEDGSAGVEDEGSGNVVEDGSAGVEDGGSGNVVKVGSAGVRDCGLTELGPPRVLLLELCLKLANLRERSGPPPPWMKRAQATPRTGALVYSRVTRGYRRTIAGVPHVQMPAFQRSGENVSKRSDESEDDQRLESHVNASDVW